MAKHPSNRHYTVGVEKADHLIEELAQECSGSPAAEKLLREILTTAAKLGLESGNLGDLKLVNSTLKEMRYSAKMFNPYQDTRKVAIFGSARVSPDHPCYQMAQALAAKMAAAGWQVITGAGGGIMEASNRGAGPDRSFGLNIHLPFEQNANSYIEGNAKLMRFKYFFPRKLAFIKESHATVLFPGGFGTLDEGFENLTLFQTGKCMPRPILFLEPPSGTYWAAWWAFLEKELFSKGYLSPDDRHLFQRVDDVDAAAQIIRQFYRVYHSLRYVGPLTVLRLVTRPSPATVDRLNLEYADLLAEGRFEVRGALPEELKKNEVPLLPRLVFRFNRRAFGRLNDLIHCLNAAATSEN